MYKHLLLPTDGSTISAAAIQTSITFAKGINAKVTGITVTPEYQVFTYQTEMLEDTRQKFAKDSKAHASQYLAVIEEAAKAAGVACEIIHVVSNHPHEAIIKTAKEKGCDLITMASHGRAGVPALLIGSETQKVLAHSRIPVLVFR